MSRLLVIPHLSRQAHTALLLLGLALVAFASIALLASAGGPSRPTRTVGDAEPVASSSPFPRATAAECRGRNVIARYPYSARYGYLLDVRRGAAEWTVRCRPVVYRRWWSSLA